jgi:flagellar L-ring protein precursor FlgH
MKRQDLMMIGVGALALFAAACATSSGPAKPSPLNEKESRDPVTKIDEKGEGSLWRPSTPVNYFSDVKARNIGDIVTINIVESASASKNAKTKTSRDSSIEASWAGVSSKLAGAWVGADQKVNFANSHDGQGETTRSSYLNAFITAEVIDKTPSGNLVIRGSRQVQVNNENQFINIQGIIRPFDIASNNIVLSTAVADARIELTGQGVVSDKQRVGWLTRVLDWVWPF